MFNPHSKFEVSAITCNEEIKGNDKCKHELIKRWDSEREPFYDDIVYLIQNTKKRGPTSFSKIKR